MSQPPSLPEAFAAIGAAIFPVAAAALGYLNWSHSVSQGREIILRLPRAGHNRTGHGRPNTSKRNTA